MPNTPSLSTRLTRAANVLTAKAQHLQTHKLKPYQEDAEWILRLAADIREARDLIVGKGS